MRIFRLFLLLKLQQWYQTLQETLTQFHLLGIFSFPRTTGKITVSTREFVKWTKCHLQEILQDMNQRNENKNVEIDPYTWSTLPVDARDFVGSLQKGFEKIKNIQGVGICWEKASCWCQRPEINFMTGLNWMGSNINSHCHWLQSEHVVLPWRQRWVSVMSAGAGWFVSRCCDLWIVGSNLD